MANVKGAEGGVEIKLDEQTAQGSYSNLAIISHSPTEFVVDFASVLPGVSKPKVVSRVILTPEHAKRLLLSLQENVSRYESNHGQIKLHHREGVAPKLTPVGEA